MVDVLQSIAQKYDRPFKLTTEELYAAGEVHDVKKSPFSGTRIAAHVGALFQTKKLVYSTVMLFLVWSIIGIAYPLFYVFLPYYLQTRGYKVEFPKM